MSVNKMSKSQNKAIEMAKYIPRLGSHDMAAVQVSDMAMMSIFDIENKKMEGIKKMRDKFDKEK
jgi:hypothetical protein